MRRVIGILLVLAVLVSLVGCVESDIDWETVSVGIWTDEETGVQYIIYDDTNRGGITVRVDAEGRPMVAQTEVGDDGR